jgi:hypothetical protein
MAPQSAFKLLICPTESIPPRSLIIIVDRASRQMAENLRGVRIHLPDEDGPELERREPQKAFAV